jgi:flagellar biosynthesis chaperone FliJ
MKRYHFSLDAVLRVRRAQEEAAGFALAHANQQRQRALQAHQDALARCQALHLQRGPQDQLSFQRERDVSERRAAAVSIAQVAVDAATDEATARLADWSAAAKLVAAVERLDDRRREEWRLEEQRVELAAIDESAIAGWLADTAATASAPAVLGVGT